MFWKPAVCTLAIIMIFIVTSQEEEFLKNNISKIASLKPRPDIVVVENTVSRLAQTYLLQSGITLIFNVKMVITRTLFVLSSVWILFYGCIRIWTFTTIHDNVVSDLIMGKSLCCEWICLRFCLLIQCVLERLARFTQACIVPSIDSIVSGPINLGFCHNFKVLNFSLPLGKTHLITFIKYR